MLFFLTILSCPKCGSGNLKDRKITQHASYLILHGSKSIVPCTKRHIGTLCAVMNWCSQVLVHPLINNNLWSSIHCCSIDNIVFICRDDIPHNRKCDVTYAQFWINIVQNLFWKIFTISIHGLVYFHQNTKQFIVEFMGTKDAKSLKQHQQFFLECIVLIIDDYINVKVISITCIGLIQ